MVKWRNVEELCRIFIEKYTNSQLVSELEKACNEEYELMRDYNGRQILELLQNVDDAYGDKKSKGNISQEEVIVKISYKENILEVGNTGTVFTDETIERLCLGRASDKSAENIGNKGTGFRSLLNDAEWIELFSGKFAIRFSKEYAKKRFNDVDGNPLISEQIENWGKDYPLCFPIMNCPEQIKKNDSSFDTLIRVKIKETNLSKDTSIEKQLEQPFYKSLLFLPNITKIILETDGYKKKYEKNILNNNYVLIKQKSGDNIEVSEKFFIHKETVKIEKEKADIIIAIPENSEYDFGKEKLYCYFPIRDFSAPIHALIHAPFITNASRDDIPNDNEEINKKIFQAIMQVVKNLAEKMITLNLGNAPIKFVSPIKNNKLWNSDFFNLWTEYLKLLSGAKILQTVNKEYISMQDEPKLLENDFPEELNGDFFRNLLYKLDDDGKAFVQDLAINTGYKQLKYNIDELSNKINSISENWTVPQRIKVFLWWSENFKSVDIVPNLLKDATDCWISKNSRVFLPTDGGISVLPVELSSWVELCVLEQEYVSELILQIKNTKIEEWQRIENEYKAEHVGDKRILAAFSEIFLSIKFTEQSSSELIVRTINNQVDTVDKSIIFINWFFENYNDKLKDGSELSKLSFNLPSSNEEIVKSDKLYFGKEYGNELSLKLFVGTEYVSLIPLEKLYKGNGENKENFILFLQRCGIFKFPKILEKDFSYNYTFRNYVKDKYNINFNINYLTSKSIQNFEKLISELDTNDIVDWITRDDKLKSLLYSEENSSNATQQSNWDGFYFKSNEYVRFVLNTTPWINLGDKKYAPAYIVKYDKLKNRINGLYGVSEQELIKYLGKDIFTILEFKESMTDLEDNDIKKILDVLPSFDDNGEISRKLYIEIIKDKKDVSPAYSTDGIKVFGKDWKFHENSEKIYYADKKLPKSVEKQNLFISIPAKQSTKTIKDWFGIDRYKTNLNLISYKELQSEQARIDFENEINEIKIIVLSTIDVNKNNIEKIKRLKIIPCINIKAEDSEQDNNLINIEDYFFVESKNVYYLKLTTDFSVESMRKTDAFSTTMIDIFKQALTLGLENESNLIELIISKNSEGRKEKISDIYGMDKWRNSEELLFEKDAAREDIVSYFKKNGLPEKQIAEIEKINFYSSIFSEEEYKIIIESLRIIKKDVKDLNNVTGVCDIDIIKYWNSQLKRLLNSYYERYRQTYYCLAKNGNREKSDFLNKMEEYTNFDVKNAKIPNSIEVDLEKIATDIFPELKQPDVDEQKIDDNYCENVSTILKQLNIIQSDLDYFFDNNNDTKIKSVLYFEIPDNLSTQIENFLKSKESEKKNEDNSTVRQKETSTIATHLEAVNTDNSDFYQKQGGKHENSKRTYAEENKQNDNAGEAAEKIAYNELKKEYPTIIWHSKYSPNPADKNKLPPNQIVCDMWVSDVENGNKYFEIKSAITEFEMTLSEYYSMKNNLENYEVILVDRGKRQISHHKFDELELLKQPSKYLFRFKQICDL